MQADSGKWQPNRITEICFTDILFSYDLSANEPVENKAIFRDVSAIWTNTKKLVLWNVQISF